MKASDPIAAKNEEILAHVESVGGGYVWEPEFFAVTLFDVPVTDSEISSLSELRGVQQIALNASNLSFPAIESIAHIPALESLVLCQHTLSAEQVETLRRVGPEIELVSDEA